MSPSPDKKSIIIGTNNGEVAVFDTKTLQRKVIVNLNSHGKRQVTGQTGNWVQTIQFSHRRLERDAPEDLRTRRLLSPSRKAWESNRSVVLVGSDDDDCMYCKGTCSLASFVFTPTSLVRDGVGVVGVEWDCPCGYGGIGHLALLR